MRKTAMKSRLLSMVLCICMVLSLLPGIPLVAKAAGTDGMITIEMVDSFGDGWNGNAIEVYANGELLDTATIAESAENGVWSTALNPHVTYELKWVTGSYADETSFVIYAGTKEELSAEGSAYSDGDILVTLDDTCDSSEFENGVCVHCGTVCLHFFTDDSNICTVCGFICGTTADHVWTDGVCSLCGAVCTHESVTDGVCDTCSGICGTTFNHSFDSTYVCESCGFSCAEHSWSAGVCSVCGAPCAHNFDDAGFCGICKYYESAPDTNADGYYEISTVGQLYWFAAQVNGGNGTMNAVLMQDIVVNAGVMTASSTNARPWTSIGCDNVQGLTYNGIFDGQNHTISGLYFTDASASWVGLFGFVSKSAVVQNVTVADSYFSGRKPIGAIVGQNCGFVINCHNRNTAVSGCAGGFSSNIGGVVGLNLGTVERCTNTGNVSGTQHIGGIVGENYRRSTVSDCSNHGTVTGSYYVGGVVGSNGDDAPVTGCHNTGTVSGREDVGGVVGLNKGSAANCGNIGNVSGTGMVGGIVGTNDGSVSSCYSTGTVSGNTDVSDTVGVFGSGGTATNNYYLSDSETEDGGKTAEQFASGEVAYLLGEGWGQTIGQDALPVLGGAKVYQNLKCNGEVSGYSNEEIITKHKYVNQICQGCGAAPGDEVLDGVTYVYGGVADKDWDLWNVEAPTYWIAGEGYAYFNPETGVLTLDNATIYAESASSDDAAVVYKQDLTINFSGTNTLTTNDHNGGTVLYCEGQTVMNGIGEDAVLNLYSGYRSNDNDYEVRAVSLSNLTVNSGTLNVVSGNGSHTTALSATTITVAEGAVVNAIAGNGLGGFSAGVMAQKLTVEGTLNASSGSCGTGFEAATSCDVVVVGTPIAGNGTINGLCMAVAMYISKIDYIACGNATLSNNRILQLMHSAPISFTVPEGTTLTIAEGVTLDLSVATEIDFSGTVVNNGTIILPASCDINNAPKSGTVVIGGNRFIWNGQKWGCADESQHTGGQATCSKIAICELCGETYGDYDYDNHAGETYVEFEWNPYDDGTCYVNATLYCADCDGYIDSNSDYAEQTGSVEATDCLNPGSVTYSITLSLNEQEYTETKTYTILSENHVGEPVNGFCSTCGGYEAAVWNEEKSVYEISNAGQLYWYAQYLNTQNAEIYAELTADIIIPENAPNWEPINASYAYFNGNYHTISGLKCIGGDMTYVGMFGLEGWWYEISNLHITDSYFEGKEYVGAVVACMSNGGSVTNCAVTNTTVKGDDYKVGGLVGYLGVSHAINCYSAATVVGENGNVLVGYYSSGYGSIENSYYLSETETEDGGKTAEQFASGEVAFLLQSGVAEDGYYDENDEWVSYIPEIWGQSIGEDDYPVLKGEKVYEGYVHCDVPGYTNNANSKEEPHSYIDGICDVCDHVCTHDTIADGECDECGLKMYTVSVDNDKMGGGIEIIEGVYAFEGKDYTGKLTLSRRYAPSSDFRFIITIGGQPTTNYSLVAGVLTIPAEFVTGDVVITCEGELVRIDTEIDCVDHCAGALSPYTVEWAEDYSSATFTYTCAFCDEVLSKTVGVSSEVISKPTCSEEGVDRYSAAYGDFQATKDVPTEKDPNAHTWLDATCTAPATCPTCGETEGEALGHIDADNNGCCDVCFKVLVDAKISFATASLEGNIAINFYTLLSEEVAADPNAYMQFTMANGTPIKVPVSQAVSGVLNGETYYVFTCAVNAKEMADDVICQFFYEGGSTTEVTYSVKAYGNYIVNNSDDASAKALAQAMLNYGAASQIHFGYNTDNLANDQVATPDYSDVVIEGYDVLLGQGTENAKFYSASLILKSETTLRFFFTGEITSTYQGQELEVLQRSGLYYVDVVGIAAKDLDKDVTIVINGDTEVTFNPMAYCQGVQNSDSFDADMKDLVAALYLYNQASNNYFEEN